MRNCEMCMNSRPVLSENGWHYNCVLSSKKAVECFNNLKYYIPHPASKVEEEISIDIDEQMKDGIKIKIS